MLRLVGHQPSGSGRTDRRLTLAAAGAFLLLVAYLLPWFSNRITWAETRFTGDTVIVSQFPVLIAGQHYDQAQRPLREELQDIRIRVESVPAHKASGWGWLFQVLTLGPALAELLSYFVCLLVPLLAVGVVGVIVGLSWFGPRRLPEVMIPLGINLAALAIPSLVLAWFHQFDFSLELFAIEQAAFWPQAGFWLGLAGSALMFAGIVGLRQRTRRPIVTWWALVLVIALGIWLLIRFRPHPFLEIWDFIFDGILVTLRITTTSFGFILAVSLLGGLGRISRSRIIYGISSLYVEIVRGIPLLVQLLFIWFALPQVFDALGELLVGLSPRLNEAGQRLIDLRLSPFTAAVLGLTICYGAYGSEIFRAGISSIHHGQMEAARSLGMNYIQAMRYVILPQAIRVILPPVGNEFVALLKDSTLVSVLAVSDLTRRGREYMARTFLSLQTWTFVALCYLVLTLFSSRVVEYIESKSRFGASR